MQQRTPIEEVLLALQIPSHRQSVADLRSNFFDIQRHVGELETECRFLRNRVAELETLLQVKAEVPVTVPAPIKTLEDLISQLKTQFQQKIEEMRRKAAEDVRNADDPAFDAALELQRSATRAMKPLPKNFEFVDLQQMRDSLLQEGYTPTSPLYVPHITEFVAHIDSIRQCTKDQRFAHMYRDPIRADTLRKMFDMNKAVESKLGSTSHLSLPPPSVKVSQTTGEDLLQFRAKETSEHLQVIGSCGEVFERAVREVTSLDDQFLMAQTLPSLASDFDAVTNGTTNDLENLTVNEKVLRDSSSAIIDHIKSIKSVQLDSVSQHQNLFQAKTKEVDGIFAKIQQLLAAAEEGYISAKELFSVVCKSQLEAARCDIRVRESTKALETELMKQQRFSEGTRFTSYLAGKAKELYKKLYVNMEESMRSRREQCERAKNAAQEQLYAMAENLHDIVSKRINADNLAIRNDQHQLDTCNRSLMGLVHVPQEMEKQMDVIRKLTVSISASKHRLHQDQVDIQSIKQILAKYNTLQFLKRDSNFLSVFDGVEKTAKLKERLDDSSQKVKFVSEVLVEISDPETRQDYVVLQAIEALKQTVADFNDLLPSKSAIEDLDEQFRVNTSTRLKRHKRLIAHFLEELREGTNDLHTKYPSVEAHTMTLLDNLQVVLSALTHNEEPVPQHLRSAYLQSAGIGATPQSYYDAQATAPGGAAAAVQGGGLGAAPKSFGGGARSLAASSPGDTFGDAEEAVHTFSRVSDRIKLSNESKKITKVPGGMEMSNTSALGAVGFRPNTGIHFFAMKIGANCSRLLVGLADWNLPLDGYCNSIKYPCCYYLHVGNGTLWCPEQKIERRQYTYEAIGSHVGGILKCILDTNERTISFAWQDTNLGIAFKNVNLARTLYPACEVFSNNCSVEFVSLSEKK
jgi:hypothetical protein